MMRARQSLVTRDKTAQDGKRKHLVRMGQRYVQLNAVPPRSRLSTVRRFEQFQNGEGMVS
jgi:hypothetical protein